jgi:hypothetical protein
MRTATWIPLALWVVISPYSALAAGQDRPSTSCPVPNGDAEIFAQVQEEARKGNAVGQAFMGAACLVTKNYSAALEWLIAAAEQGHVGASMQVADVYAAGAGIVVDFTGAARLTRRAAEAGAGYAQYALGVATIEGRGGVPRNIEEGFAWIKKAADRTCPPPRPDGELPQDPSCGRAQLLLAEAYLNGDLPEDYVLGYMWADLAVVWSIPSEQARAARLRGRIAHNLTSDELAEARKRSREWVPTIQPR